MNTDKRKMHSKYQNETSKSKSQESLTNISNNKIIKIDLIICIIFNFSYDFLSSSNNQNTYLIVLLKRYKITIEFVYYFFNFILLIHFTKCIGTTK